MWTPGHRGEAPSPWPSVRARARVIGVSGSALALALACSGEGGEHSTTTEDGGTASGGGSVDLGAPVACEDHLNVVLVAIESTRFSATTPYVPSLTTTPFLDGLAKGGVQVKTAYTVVPHTTKALVPMHCGIYPKLVKSIIEPDEGAIPTDCLARRLARVGYATYFIQPARSSFERREGLVQNFGFAEFDSKETLPNEGFDESSYFGFEDDVMLAPALEWIDAQTCPFFLGVLTLTSHHNYGVPEGFPTTPYSDDETFNNYLNTVSYTDRFVGKLHAALGERGLLEKTIFVVVGDHGEAFGEHGRTQHDNVIWDEGLHVPLILSGPGVGAPRVLEGLYQTLDIPPTIERLLGLDLGPSDYLGVDILSSPGHSRLYHSCWFDQRCMAMREGTRKVVYHFDLYPTAVYDLAADPGETKNVIAEGDNQAFADAGLAAMDEWLDGTNSAYDAALASRGIAPRPVEAEGEDEDEGEGEDVTAPLRLPGG